MKRPCKLCPQWTKVWREVTNPRHNVVTVLTSAVFGVTETLKLIKQGYRVKLTARAAAAFSKRRGGKAIWTARRGVVLRITTNKTDAVVLWDGRMSWEYLPIGAIEFAASSTGESRGSSGRISALAEQSH